MDTILGIHPIFVAFGASVSSSESLEAYWFSAVPSVGVSAVSALDSYLGRSTPP